MEWGEAKKTHTFWGRKPKSRSPINWSKKHLEEHILIAAAKERGCPWWRCRTQHFIAGQLQINCLSFVYVSNLPFASKNARQNNYIPIFWFHISRNAGTICVNLNFPLCFASIWFARCEWPTDDLNLVHGAAVHLATLSVVLIESKLNISEQAHGLTFVFAPILLFIYSHIHSRRARMPNTHKKSNRKTLGAVLHISIDGGMCTLSLSLVQCYLSDAMHFFETINTICFHQFPCCAARLLAFSMLRVNAITRPNQPRMKTDDEPRPIGQQRNASLSCSIYLRKKKWRKMRANKSMCSTSEFLGIVWIVVRGEAGGRNDETQDAMPHISHALWNFSISILIPFGHVQRALRRLYVCFALIYCNTFACANRFYYCRFSAVPAELNEQEKLSTEHTNSNLISIL